MGGSTTQQVFELMYYFLYAIQLIIAVAGAILVGRILRGSARRLGVTGWVLFGAATVSGLIREPVAQAIFDSGQYYNTALFQLWDMLTWIVRLAGIVCLGLALLATGRNLREFFTGTQPTAQPGPGPVPQPGALPPLQQQPFATPWGGGGQPSGPSSAGNGTVATHYLPPPQGPGRPAPGSPYPPSGNAAGQRPGQPPSGGQPRGWQ